MSSLNFKFVAVALSFVLLASAAVPNKRNTQWLQQNAPAAKALNDQYTQLTANSTCSNNDDHVCIGGAFATCYEGQYLIAACPSGWSCAAIPNEWSEGTTTTCDTNDDIARRFSEAGVSETKRSAPEKRQTTTSWLQQNGPAAKALNDQYAKLNVNSTCTDDQVACIGGAFATCNDGRFFVWPCPTNWTCAAIPNERSNGTTTTCDSVSDIQWRFSQAGVSES